MLSRKDKYQGESQTFASARARPSENATDYRNTSRRLNTRRLIITQAWEPESPPIASTHTPSPEHAAVFAPRSHVYETLDLRTPASVLNIRSPFPTSHADEVAHAHTHAILAATASIGVAIVTFVSDQFTRTVCHAMYRCSAL
jgi:hypothetical protein